LIHFDTIDLAPHRAVAPPGPSVLNHHNVESVLFLRRAPYERNPLAGAYLHLQASKLDRLEKEWYQRFSANLFVSESDRARAMRQSPGLTARVVPNGVDVDYYRPERGKEDERIVWVGGLGWFPNRDAVRWMIGSVWPHVRALRPRAVLDLVGAAPPGVLQREGAAPGVEAHGFVEDIRPIVARASVFVAPLRVGGGTRLKILDAMAMGKAIVATTLGAEGIGAESEKEIVRADSPREFANAIVHLLEDPDRRRVLGENARSLAERRFAWEVVGDRFLRIYRAIAAGRTIEEEDALDT
jgi:glycosyltransferase involved in cell wall biosynthesis